MEFTPLGSVPGVRAAFLPRMAGVDVDTDRETALLRLTPVHRDILATRGFDADRVAFAEQIHGAGVVVVSAPGMHPGVDALVTREHGLVLGIHVADCAAVYIADRQGRVAGLAHSGRAGTELDITGRTIAVMCEVSGAEASDFVVELSPCIRPPLYETDFAATIVRQARAAGVQDVRDEGICTGREVGRYYSYRVERGRTGRMLAALSLLP